MASPRPAYRDLYFGMSDSRNEATANPDEFVRSYVDLSNTVEHVLHGKKFLVLGPKGAGKSALAWFLELTEDRATHLALVRDASQLPLAEIPRLKTGQSEGPERTVVAWRFILLCNYLELLLRDQSSSIQANAEAMRVASLLRDFGFMGDASGRALVTASTTTIQVPIPQLGPIYKRESKRELNIYHLNPYLESWVTDAKSPQLRHTLLLDGLDSIFLNDPKYNESLSSLVQAAYLLNQQLYAAHASGCIVLLLRNDVFSRISQFLPDSQKMRDDLSVALDWRVLSGEAGVNAPLFRLVNSKAAHASGLSSVDVLSYFPPDIQLGPRGQPPRWIPTVQYFLNLTRHTPRDLLRLFEEIRKVEASDVFPTRGRFLSRDVIREGVLRYCTEYFVGAISNEFAGFQGGPAAATACMSALQALNRQVFSQEDFKTALVSCESDLANEHRRLLTLLFYAGAIGNLIARHSGGSYLKFYHRRDDAEIYLRGQFILHNALVHAWNIPFGT